MINTNVDTVRALYSALSAGQHGESLRPFFTDDASTLEHPNAIKPRGGRTPAAQMFAESVAGASLLARQSYDVRTIDVLRDTVVVRLIWRGEIAREVGKFSAGQQLTAHIAQFIAMRDGRIAEIETFDCYEPFDSGAA